MSRVATALCRFIAPPADRRTDGALLAAFLGDQDEAAFEELVRRHGPLVWGLCRRTLPDPADAEDAFQAAFLVLVRRANRLTGHATVGPWLYKVAAWTARNLRRRNARRLARRVALPPDTPDHAPGTDAADLAADLDAALLALPEKYRTPLILCHLQGWSRRDAAERLRVPEGTLSALLSRGLAKLRDRLAGHDPVKALGTDSAVVPLVLVAATARAAGAARLALGGTVSASVSQLVEGVLHMFWVQKATAASFGLVVVFGLGLGVGVSVRQVPRAAADDTTPTVKVPIDVAVLDDELIVVRLEVADADEQEAKEKLKAAEEKLKKAAKGFADGKVPAEQLTRDAQELKHLQMKLEEIEQMRADLIARIKDSEVKRAAPRAGGRAGGQPPPSNPADPKPKDVLILRQPEPKPGAGPFRGAGQEVAIPDQLKQITAQLQELEAMQQKLQAERAKIQAEAERIRAMAEIYAQKQKDLAARARDDLKPRTADPGAVRGKLATGSAGHLEVVVGGPDAWWPCWVKEYGADGKAVGAVVCDSVPMLDLYLTRTASDPKAPKEVRITSQPGASQDRVKAVQDACRAAKWRTQSAVGGEADALRKRIDLGIDPPEIRMELQRAAERALRDEQNLREQTLRALEEAQQQLERLKWQPDRANPEPPKPPPGQPKPPTPPKPPKNPDGDD